MTDHDTLVIVGGCALFIAYVLLSPFAIVWLWGLVMLDLGAPRIDYWHAMGLQWLVGMLVGPAAIGRALR